jgi:hypothetical protein
MRSDLRSAWRAIWINPLSTLSAIPALALMPLKSSRGGLVQPLREAAASARGGRHGSPFRVILAAQVSVAVVLLVGVVEEANFLEPGAAVFAERTLASLVEQQLAQARLLGLVRRNGRPHDLRSVSRQPSPRRASRADRPCQDTEVERLTRFCEASRWSRYRER